MGLVWVVWVAMCACSSSSTSTPVTPDLEPRPITVPDAASVVSDPDPSPASVPGVVWSTEAPPWYPPHDVYALAIDGDRALGVGSSGWVIEIDLVTGKTLRQKQLGRDVTLYDVARLPGNRWIAVGTDTPTYDSFIGFAIDGATLAATQIPLTARKPTPSTMVPHVAVLREGVVITAWSLPLAVYDPQTWAVRATLDPQPGWGVVAARGDVVLADRDGVVLRFDRAAKTSREVTTSKATSHLAITGDGLSVMRVVRGTRVWAIEIASEGREPKVIEPEAGFFAIDALGTRLITTWDDDLRIHALPSGQITKRTKTGSHGPGLRMLAARGSQLAISTDGVLRMVDLDHGTLTPRTEAERVFSIGVDNAGHVTAIGDARARRVLGGRQLGSHVRPDQWLFEVSRLDGRHVVATGTQSKRVELIDVATARPISSWQVPSPTFRADVVRDGGLIVSYEKAGTFFLGHVRAGKLTPIRPISRDASVVDVDLDGRVMIESRGRFAVLPPDRKPTGVVIDAPCMSNAWAIESGGTRVLAWTAEHLGMWEHASGKLLANVVLEGAWAVTFIPNRAEIAIVYGDRIDLWTPGTGIRRIAWSGARAAAASPDGKKLAIGFADSHLAVLDVDALMTLPVGPDLTAGAPLTSCGTWDPLAPDPPDPP